MPPQTAWEIRDAGSGERVNATQQVERLPDDLKLAFYRRSEHRVGLVVLLGLPATKSRISTAARRASQSSAPASGCIKFL
jgi:hypothetical protein